MHFTGMLAFHLPVPVAYYWPTVLSVTLYGWSILGSTMALRVQWPLRRWAALKPLIGSILMGVSHCRDALHRHGLEAISGRDPASNAITFNPLPRGSPSVLIAVVASFLAGVLLRLSRGFQRNHGCEAPECCIDGCCHLGDALHSRGCSNFLRVRAALAQLGAHGEHFVARHRGNRGPGRTNPVQGVAIFISAVDRPTGFSGCGATEKRALPPNRRQFADSACAGHLGSQRVSLRQSCLPGDLGSPDRKLLRRPQILDWKLVHPEDRGRVEGFVQRLIGGQPIENLEYRVIRPGGSTSWVAGRGYPIRDTEGRASASQWAAFRTSPSVRSSTPEERLREYEKAVEGLEEMIVVVDREYRYLLANRAFLKYRNLEREKLLGRLVPDFLDREVFDRIIKPKLDECFQGRVVHYELRYKYPHLGERDLDVSYFPIEGPHGVDRAACVLQDVTERKRANATIRQEQEQAQRYLDVARVILLALDLEGRITMINRKGCATLGWEERELLRRDWIDTCLPVRIRDKLSASFHNLLGGDLSYIENPILTKSGEERLIGWRNTLLRDEEGRITGTLSSGEDITERKQAEEELRRLSGKLLRLQDEERRKIGGDLHDSTGQDLVALATMLGQLKDSIPSVERKSRRLFSDCKALAERSIREVRTLSYLLHPPVLDRAGLEDAIRDYVKGFSDRSGIQVELELSPRLGRMPRDVEVTLFRVVQESLTNTQRHSGSQRARIRIHRSLDFSLEISDFGPGAPPVCRKRKVKLGSKLVLASPACKSE